MEPQIEPCETCRFYNGWNCYRYPPKPITTARSEQDRGEDLEATWNRLDFCYPVTYAGCGEHQPRKEA